MDAVLFFACMLTAAVSVSASGWQYEIYVNNTGGNNDSCWQAKEYKLCPSINLALQAVKSSTVIYLYPGNYTLKPGIETEVRNVSNVAIIGRESLDNSVIINCAPKGSTGLSFVFSNNTVLESVNLLYCGAVQNSTSTTDKSSPLVYIPCRVAVYMLFCVNVRFTNVVFHSSNGTGLTIYNTVGTVSLENTSFILNGPYNYTVGGTGLQIQFSYCIPGDVNCSTESEQIAPFYTSNATINILNCTFRSNKAYRHYSYLRKIVNDGIHSFDFGRGGGISIILKGHASNNDILLKHCSILQNYAHLGGGFYVSFHDTTSNNIVSIEDSEISGNENYDVDKNAKGYHWDVDGGGGGGKIIFADLNGISKNNLVNITKCEFTNNIAISGGGLWIETALNDYSVGNTVSLISSNFIHNTAFLGSGAYLSSGFKKSTITVFLTSLSFISNNPICSKDTQLFVFLPCSGILYTKSLPIIIKGTMTFSNNTASAIEIHDANLDIWKGCDIEFTGNRSPYGGALALYDCSFITVYSNTSLTFINNTAEVLGGAIYAGSCAGASQPATISVQCFMRYFDSTIHPDNWDTMFTFINNTAKSKVNALYAVSVSPCWWPEENSTFVLEKDIKNTFCWKTWKYSKSDCISSTTSAPAFVSYKTEHFNIYPGQKLTLPSVLDGTERELLDTKLKACIDSGPASFDYFFNKPCMTTTKLEMNIHLYYKCIESHCKGNQSVRIAVETNGDGVVGLFRPSFKLYFSNCSWPYDFDGKQCSFKHDYFSCSDNEKCGIGSLVQPKAEYCVTKTKSTSHSGLVVGHCPLAYNARPNYQPMLQGSTQACRSHHSGMLCGECEPSYGIPINSVYLECVNCQKSHFPGWLLFVMFEILPVTIMVIFIILFDVKLTTGIMSGFVFYSQIVTLDFPVWYYPAWFTFDAVSELKDPLDDVHFNRLATTLYSVWNLNFLTPIPPSSFPICISNHMEPLGFIAFWYIVPIYPLILMFIITGWILLYIHGIKLVVYVTRPVHQRLARFWRVLVIEPSLIDSFAGIYVLCFTQLATNSFKLLHYTTWQSLKDENKFGKAFFFNGNITYFGWPHAMYALLAIAILVFLVFLPTIFLLLFPFKFFHRFLDCIKIRKQILIAFGDVFTGTFRDGSDGSMDFRCFAGLYLLLRIFILCFYYIPSQHSEVILYLETATCVVFGGIVMIFRPFKRTITNFANFMIILLLGLMSALCLISEQKGVLVNLVSLVHIPMIVAFCYFIYWIRGKVISVYRYYKNSFSSNLIHDETTEEDNDDENLIIDNDNLPDRLVNPGDYNYPPMTHKSPRSSIHSTSNNVDTLPNDATIPLRITISYGSSYGSTKETIN